MKGVKILGARPTYRMDGEKLKKILLERNLTNQDVYTQDGLRRDSFLNALNGGQCLQRTACRIAKVLNCNVTDIVER